MSIGQRVLIALLLAPLTGLSARSSESGPKPNIVFFLADDMDWQETAVPMRDAMRDELPDEAVWSTPKEQASSTSKDKDNLPMQADVWLLGGQSNMQGIAKIADLLTDLPRAIPHAFFWNGEAFEPLVLGQTRTSTREGEFGPEVGFALGMSTADRPVYLVKDHASGMPLHHGWDGNEWVGGEPQPGRRNFHPGENRDDPNQGTLYRAMLAKYRAPLCHLRENGRKPNLRGFLWMQGEQDSKHVDSATGYALSLKRLRARLAADLGVARDLPLVFGQVLPYEPALERFTHRTEIRAQMAAADMNSGQPEAMARTKMVSTDRFGLAADTVHYNADGQLRLGQAFAAAMKILLAAGGGPTELLPRSDARVPRSAIAEALERRGVAMEETDRTIWGASPVIAEANHGEVTGVRAAEMMTALW